MIWLMTLQQFLSQNGLSQHTFAKMAGITQVTVSRYVNGLRLPRRAHMKRIYEVTGGSVTPNDFFAVREDSTPNPEIPQ
jgi:transcriptional regulator with XRE-family HTH domain